MKVKKDDLTAERVRELLDYNPLTGVFTWRIDPAPNNKKAGKVAGRPHSKGYWCIGIGGHCYFAHRIAWLHTFGRWPAKLLDHRDGNPANNRIANLREASVSENGANHRRLPGAVGLRGVQRCGRKYRAQIQSGGRHYYLGIFETRESAHEAYRRASKELHGEFSSVA